MQRYGLTGGIASGKSTVAGLFRGLGAACIDADALYHRLLLPPTPGRPSPLSTDLAAAFGAQLLRDDGSLDRAALGARVFVEPAARQQLEALTHPAIRRAAEAAFAELAAAGHPIALYDVPLLFEKNLEGQFAGTILVWVPASIQRLRLLLRDGGSDAAASARLAAQLPLDDKRRRATYVIDNGGELAGTAAQVQRCWQQLQPKN